MSKSAAIFAAMAAMLWMAGCADKDPVSSQNEGADSAAGKLVISKTKAAGECNVPGCRPGFGGGGTFGPRQSVAANKAIDFSSDVGSYVKVPLSSSLEINGTEITLETWIAFKGDNGQFFVGSDYALQNQFLTGPGAWQYSTYFVGFYQSTPPTGGTPVLGGVWQHVAFTGSSNGGRKFYLNGVETTSFNASYGPLKAARDFFMGGGSFVDGGPGTNEYLNGQLDEVRVWNRALTQAEIQANMNKTLAGSENGLIGYWTFDKLDASGHVPDKSGHGNDGIIVGSARLVDSTAPIR